MSDHDIAYEFELTGGALCLDFANTLGDRPLCCEEHLDGYDDLLSWARQTDVLSVDELEALAGAARRDPERARETFEDAVALREALYRIFGGLARSERPQSDDLAILNGALQSALPHLRVADRSAGFGWVWTDSDASFDSPIWPVARSAADLLTSDETIAIRECASETCSWLFVDRSRTRRRRWCDMSTCGNRAKARRHYERQKQRQSTG